MTEPGKDTSVDIHTPAELLELSNRLQDELKTLEIAKATAELNINSCDFANLQESVAELKDKLLEESNNASLRQLIIKRLEMQVLLSEVLFDPKDERDFAITDRITTDLQMASEIMRILKDSSELPERLYNLRMENLRLKHDNIALMERLKSEEEKAQEVSEDVLKNKDYRILKAEMDVRSKSLSILKNTIPRLAVGAGILNPQTQELILQCGQSSNVQ